MEGTGYSTKGNVPLAVRRALVRRSVGRLLLIVTGLVQI